LYYADRLLIYNCHRSSFIVPLRFTHSLSHNLFF